MPYTVGFTIIDLGSFYSGGFPPFGGTLDLPGLGNAVVATASGSPLTMTFTPAANPPSSLGSLLVTDPSGPGDFFRSGPLSTWPAEPAVIQAGTVIVPRPFSVISIPTPRDINIDPGIGIAIGAATGFMFSPRLIRLTNIVIGPSTTPGALRARFRGIIEYFTLFFPRRTDVTGTVDLTITPSGDAMRPGTVVNVSASNLSLSPGFTTPISTLALVLLAPAFSGVLAGPLTSDVNATIAPAIAAARAMAPTNAAGMSIFSSAATVSIRRIVVLPSGLIIHAVLGELIPIRTAPPVTKPPDTGAADQLLVTIEPAPEADITQIYVVRVRKALDGSAVDNAEVSIVTYNAFGGALTITGQTDAQGTVALEATLRYRAAPNPDPFNTGQLRFTSPKLVVRKTGFQNYSQDLLPTN